MKRRHGQPPSAASAGARPRSAALAWPLLLSMALGCAAPALQAGELVPDPDHFMGGEPVEPAPPVPRPAPADRAESLAALLQRVLAADPQVRVALAQWQAAEQRRLQLRSRLGPTVSVTGTRGNGLEREFGVLLERHTDRAADTVLVIVNPGDQTVTEAIQWRNGQMMDADDLRDLIPPPAGSKRLTAGSGLVRVSMPPHSVRVLAPVTTPGPGGYSVYKRMP